MVRLCRTSAEKDALFVSVKLKSYIKLHFRSEPTLCTVRVHTENLSIIMYIYYYVSEFHSFFAAKFARNHQENYFAPRIIALCSLIHDFR